MVSMTLAIPLDLKAQMDRYPEMNWSEIARMAIRTRLELLAKLDDLTKESTLTVEDTIELGRKTKKGVAQRYRKIAGERAKAKVKR